MSKFQPYIVRTGTEFLQKRRVVLAETFCGVRAVGAIVYMPGLDLQVTDVTIHDWHLPGTPRAQFTLDTETPLQSFISSLKESMLTGGATAEAVRLVGEWFPFTKEENVIMAEKLAKKGAVKAPAEKPAKAAKEPKAPKEAAAPDTRKVKILNKENPYRAESGRAQAFDAILKAKTVADYDAAGGKRKYLARWVDEKRIELS